MSLRLRGIAEAGSNLFVHGIAASGLRPPREGHGWPSAGEHQERSEPTNDSEP